MIYPLVRELAADGIPVTVTCRVLKIARQPYYRWLADPVTDTEWNGARLADAVFDAHRRPRVRLPVPCRRGVEVCKRTVWRVCRDNGWGSVFGKPKNRKAAKPGTTPSRLCSALRQWDFEHPLNGQGSAASFARCVWLAFRAEGATCRNANFAAAAAPTLVPMRFTAAVTHEGPWQVARCLEVEVASQGGTVEEALANLREALELYFEDEMLPESIEPPIIATIELSA